MIITPEYATRSCVKGWLEQWPRGSPVAYSRAPEFGSTAEAASSIQGVEVGCFASSKYGMGNDQSSGTDENGMDFPSIYQKKTPI